MTPCATSMLWFSFIFPLSTTRLANSYLYPFYPADQSVFVPTLISPPRGERKAITTASTNLRAQIFILKTHKKGQSMSVSKEALKNFSHQADIILQNKSLKCPLSTDQQLPKSPSLHTYLIIQNSFFYELSFNLG